MAPTNVKTGNVYEYEFDGKRGQLKITIPYTNSNNNRNAAGISVQYLRGPNEGLHQHFTPAMWERVTLSQAGGKRKTRKATRSRKHKTYRRRR